MSSASMPLRGSSPPLNRMRKALCAKGACSAGTDRLYLGNSRPCGSTCTPPALTPASTKASRLNALGTHTCCARTGRGSRQAVRTPYQA